MLRIAIHGYSPIEQPALQEKLTRLVVEYGGWILEEKPLSFAACHLRLEVGLSDFAEFYGALQQSGLQFTPVAHRALVQMCLCQKHLSENDALRVVAVDLHVETMAEGNIHILRFARQQPV